MGEAGKVSTPLFNFVLSGIFLMSVSSCALAPPKSPASSMSLSEVRSALPFNTTYLDEVRKMLGKPDLELGTAEGLKSLSKRGLTSDLPIDGNEIVWFYLDQSGKGVRLSLSFNKDSKQLTRLHWVVSPGDAERDIPVARAQFPEEKFRLRRPAWTNPHMGPTTASLSGEKDRVVITYSTLREKVESISISSGRTRSTAASN